MRTEPYEDDDGYRVWLSADEIDDITSLYSEQPRKQIAISLMVDCGMRSDEVTTVSEDDIREIDDDKYMISIEQSKNGYRECPIPGETVSDIRTIHNVQSLNKRECIIDVTTRTVQRWVTDAADQLRDDMDGWQYVSAHDLRRTWATRLYWSISGDRSREVVMAWGGWTDVQTFSDHYLGAIPDTVTADIMDGTDIYTPK